MKPKDSKDPKGKDDKSSPFTKRDFEKMVDKAIIKPEPRKPAKE